MMKLSTVKFRVNDNRKCARFTRAAAAAEFGSKYWGWREWSGFRDYTPAQLERLRAEQRLRTGLVL